MEALPSESGKSPGADRTPQARLTPGCVSIDMDTLSDYARGYGFTYARVPDPVYELGLPRFLDDLSRREIKATIFVIGRDARVPEHAAILRRAVADGHELANHTMTHPRRLADLPDEELACEIREAHEIISEVRGSAVAGFRAPCYDVSNRCMDRLRDAGYLYDSSVHPIALAAVIDLAVLIKSRFRIREARTGTYTHVLAPVKPYRPAARRYWRPTSAGSLIELPLSTVPRTRMPFYGTFVQATGMKRFRRSLARLGRTDWPLNFHYHAVELVEINDVGVDRRLAVHPGLTKPLGEKQADVDEMLRSFDERYELMPLEQMARHHLNGGGRTGRKDQRV